MSLHLRVISGSLNSDAVVGEKRGPVVKGARGYTVPNCNVNRYVERVIKNPISFLRCSDLLNCLF